MKLVGSIISHDGVLQGTWEAEGTPEEMADFIARRQLQLTVHVSPWAPQTSRSQYLEDGEPTPLPTTSWSSVPVEVVRAGVDPAVPSGPSEDL